MSWGAVAGAVGSIAVGALGSKNKGSGGAKPEDQRDSSIEQIISDLISSNTTTGSKDSSQSTSQDQTSTSEQDTSQTGSKDTSGQREQSQSSDQSQTSDQSQASEQSQSSKQSQTVQRGDSATQSALAAIIAGGAGDGEGQIQALMNQILSEGKAGISNVGTRTGSFGSTTEQLLANDLITKAATAGVNQQNVLQQQLLEAIKTSQGGTETSTGTGSSTGSETSTGTATSTGTESSTGSETSSGSENSQTDSSTKTLEQILSEALSSSTENTTEQSDSTQSQDQTSVSDSYTDVKAPAPNSGGLADLIAGGQQLGGMPAPTKPVLGVGTDGEVSEEAQLEFDKSMAQYNIAQRQYEAQGTASGLIDIVGATKAREEEQARLAREQEDLANGEYEGNHNGSSTGGDHQNGGMGSTGGDHQNGGMGSSGGGADGAGPSGPTGPQGGGQYA